MRYAIFHTPRTGSNLLCDLLVKTGKAGMVDLYTAGFFIGYGKDIKASDIDLYFEKNQTPNGVQGCKIGWDYIEHLNKHLKFGEVDQFFSSLDLAIWLFRKDKLAQAISRLVARQTTQWTSEDTPTEAAVPLKYDRQRIIYFMAQMQGYEVSITNILHSYNIYYMRFSYDNLIPDFSKSIKNTLSFLDIPHTKEDLQVQPTLQKQVNPIKQEWYDRFMRGE